MRIGVISDTHGMVRNEAMTALQDSELILHAGDIGSHDVLDALAAVAPVLAVRGNIDRDPWADELPEVRTVAVAGYRIHLRHDIAGLDIEPAAEGLDAVVFGHSHKSLIEQRSGVLYLNPGSAGPRRFRLPVCLARLDVSESGIIPRIVHLDG